jgi:serine/threonine protein kinase
MSASTATPRAAEPSDLAALAGQKLGNYRLEQLVGRGRMGVVYRANDEALLRPTAVKVLSWAAAETAGQDPVQWFLSEARLVARINHPRVVQIYGVARHADLCYIAMEYVPGDSAEALVARGGPMSPEAATEILLQAATALQAAHASGVVHRDVKPGNLLVGADQVTKLGDFGIAMGPPEVDAAGGRRLRVGTPHYTAPEIWRGEAASPASDLYALGATYFQLLTGRPPFPGSDALAVEQAHLRAAVPDPRAVRGDVPACCATLAMRALAKAPRDRPASAQEVVSAARTVLHELRATVAPRAERARSPQVESVSTNRGDAVNAANPGAGPKGTSRSGALQSLSVLANLPDVRGAVLGDLAGVLLDAVREPDGETVAAVTGFLATAMAQTGELLGLGALRRIAVSGEARASLVVVEGAHVLAAHVAPPRSLAAVEKQVETSIAGRG